MKAIVTGATGYIGSHVVKHLLSNGWDVNIVADPTFGYRNIDAFRNQIHILEYNGEISTLIDFFRQVDSDVVFHLAASVITNCKPEQITTLIDSNVKFGTEVLEAMKYSRTRLFVGTGSYWQNYNSIYYSPVDLYAATKEAFEKILQYYVEAHDFRAITLRLFDVYGEDDQRPKLINLLKDIAITGKSVDVSPGNQLLDLVHVSDVAKAYEKAYELLIQDKSINNEVFGVSSNKRYSLKQVVDIFEKIIDKSLNINWGGKAYRSREVMVPTNSYKKLPNWRSEIDLPEGLFKINKVLIDEGGGKIADIQRVVFYEKGSAA